MNKHFVFSRFDLAIIWLNQYSLFRPNKSLCLVLLAIFSDFKPLNRYWAITKLKYFFLQTLRNWSRAPIPDPSHKLSLILQQKMLLGSQNRPRSTNSTPCNKFIRWKSIIRQRITSNQRPSSPQPCLTMNSNSPRLPFNQLQKFPYKLMRRAASIFKIEIIMLYPCIFKFILIIFRLIKPYNSSDAFWSKVRNVVFRRISGVLIYFGPFSWRTESKKLVWNNSA